MPTYEYDCTNCGRFEVLQNIKDEPLKLCPNCGNAVRRLISANVNIIFKGSGYYTTDNRSQDYKKRSEEDNKGTSSSGTNTDRPAANQSSPIQTGSSSAATS